MSTHGDNVAGGALQVQLSLHGQAVTYIDGDTSLAVSLAIVGQVQSSETSDDSGRTITQTRKVTFARSDVSAPKLNGEVEIDGERWAIRSVDKLTSARAVVEVVRMVSAERSRAGYRGRR